MSIHYNAIKVFISTTPNDPSSFRSYGEMNYVDEQSLFQHGAAAKRRFLGPDHEGSKECLKLVHLDGTYVVLPSIYWDSKYRGITDVYRVTTLPGYMPFLSRVVDKLEGKLTEKPVAKDTSVFEIRLSEHPYRHRMLLEALVSADLGWTCSDTEKP